MNRTPSDSELRDALHASVAAIDVPPFDLAKIEVRKPQAGTPYGFPRRSTRRLALVAVPVAIAVALVAILPSMPSVVAQVERALRGFAVIDGRTVPLTVQTVSVEQARAQMPFEVIAPAAVPENLRLTVNELYSPSSPADAHVIFEYHGNAGFPVLTVDESSASAHGPTKMMVTERNVVRGPGAPPESALPPEGAPPAALPAGGTGPGKAAYFMRSTQVKVVNGRATRQSFELHPVVWTVRGTRIVLAATPGGLSPAQVDAIRAAMSR